VVRELDDEQLTRNRWYDAKQDGNKLEFREYGKTTVSRVSTRKPTVNMAVKCGWNVGSELEYNLG
jgi:hypothetical protein